MQNVLFFTDSACPFSNKYHEHTSHLPIPSKEYVTDKNSEKDLADKLLQLQNKNVVEKAPIENRQLENDGDNQEKKQG